MNVYGRQTLIRCIALSLATVTNEFLRAIT